ncbi:MAG: leucyl aminopeptidase family protein [Candidatus Harrisonbacteria bacterium]|nr:leucyl aminopeptidase family protein [Candidatus Harrisonbacteria bacterium]
MKFNVDKHFTKSDLRRVQALLLPVWLPKDEEKAASAPRGGASASRSKKAPKTVFGQALPLLGKPDQKLIRAFVADKALKDGDVRMVKLSGAPGNLCVAAIADLSEKNFALIVRQFVRKAKSEGLKNIGIYCDDFERGNIFAEKIAGLAAQNALAAHFDFSEEFKTAPKEGWKKVETLTLFTYHDSRALHEELARGITLGEAMNRCRTLANYPAGEMSPEGLAEAAREVAKETKNVAVTVFDEKRLKAEGMNAILAVGKGSANPPRLIILEYKGGKDGEKPLTFVGKGVTFDSGGLNIKTGDSMEDMHLDMSGGAAVITAVGAIAKLGLPVNVMGLVPAAENMPSGLSYRQGDIIKVYGGKTIEVGDTDAEGRVILADAIEYAKTKKPALLVTIATLTGAVVIALGGRMAGLFVAGNKPLRDALEGIGEKSGDDVWPLPLNDDFEKDIEGKFADVTNTHKSNSRDGGASVAAAFLRHFAKPAPFAHVDMAPRMTAMADEEHLAKGAVGFGVRYFVELAARWEEVKKAL